MESGLHSELKRREKKATFFRPRRRSQAHRGKRVVGRSGEENADTSSTQRITITERERRYVPPRERSQAREEKKFYYFLTGRGKERRSSPYRDANVGSVSMVKGRGKATFSCRKKEKGGLF